MIKNEKELVKRKGTRRCSMPNGSMKKDTEIKKMV